MQQPFKNIKRKSGFLLLPLTFIFIFAAVQKQAERVRLVFETEKSMRLSFCMYSDGKFYDAQPSGCTGQQFSWGYWEKEKDTGRVQLNYQAENIFKYDIIKSTDSLNKFQIVRILDVYNQPVRFQYIYHDTVGCNLYNPGILRILKGSAIWYQAAVIDTINKYSDMVLSNADTITYRWHCNRESIESIDGGDLIANDKKYTANIIAGNKQIRRLY